MIDPNLFYMLRTKFVSQSEFLVSWAIPEEEKKEKTWKKKMRGWWRKKTISNQNLATHWKKTVLCVVSITLIIIMLTHHWICWTAVSIGFCYLLSSSKYLWFCYLLNSIKYRVLFFSGPTKHWQHLTKGELNDI